MSEIGVPLPEGWSLTVRQNEDGTYTGLLAGRGRAVRLIGPDPDLVVLSFGAHLISVSREGDFLRRLLAGEPLRNVPDVADPVEDWRPADW